MVSKNTYKAATNTVAGFREIDPEKAPIAFLTKVCLRLYDALSSEQRCRAKELFELEASLIRLYFLRLATPREDARARMVYFFRHLCRETVGK